MSKKNKVVGGYAGLFDELAMPRVYLTKLIKNLIVNKKDKYKMVNLLLS